MTDKTMTLVETIIGNLCDRRGFDSAFDVGDDILQEIKQEMADAITRHLSQPAERGEAVAIGYAQADALAGLRDGTMDMVRITRSRGLGDVAVYTDPPPAAGVLDVVFQNLAQIAEGSMPKTVMQDLASESYNMLRKYAREIRMKRKADKLTISIGDAK